MRLALLVLVLTACGASSSPTGPQVSAFPAQSLPGRLDPLVLCFPGDTIPPCNNPYGGR